MGFPWAIVAAIFSVASGAVSYVQARKAQKAAKKANDEQRGVLVNKESNIEQIPVIYGERRVGGVRVFVSTDGTYKEVSGQTDYYSDYDADTESYATTTDTPTNKYLYIALVLCEGEVESITDIYVDDLPITDSKYSGLISYNTYLGTDDQTMPNNQLLREANEFWTADHRLRGVAFLGIRFTWDEEAFSGIPEVTALVKGRKIYDPRTATTAWSDNPALCIRDYLTNTRYGKGLPSSAIDDTLIGDAADDCDQSVTLYSGGTTGKTFTCNAVLDTSKTLFDNLNTLLLGCRGFLPYTQGEYRLKIDGSSSSVMTFTTDTIIGGINIKGESKDEKFNRVTVKFPNPDANWQPDTAIWPPAGSTEETTYLSEDGGVLLHEEIELDTITNYYQARDLARVILLRSRNALTCAIKTTSEALQLEIADVVSITHATPGWTAKPFQVMGMQLNDDGTVDLALLEYDSTIYTWEVDAEQQSYPDTNLPNPFTVAAVSNITVTETTTLGDDGTVIPLGVLEWDASYDNLVNQYEIQYKLTSEADTEYKSIFTSVNKYEFYNAEVGTSFTLRIRAINSLGVKGAFTTATFTINGDQSAPSAPTGLSATVGIKNIRLDWTNPSDKDLKVVDVYRHTSNSSGSASKIASIDGESFVDQNITEDTTYYYWLKAIDYSGNASGFSGVASGAATLVTADGIVDGSIDVAKFASSIEPVTIASSVPGSKSTETVFNTSDSKLYRWSGSSYVATIPTVDLTGTITSTQITDSAITTAKLSANAVTAAKIAANTITANEIASNTITAGQIAAGAISADEIDANALEVSKISSGGSKEYSTNSNTGADFKFEFGTSTTVAGYQGAGILRAGISTSFGVAGLANADDSVAVAGQQAYNGADSYGGYFANSTALGSLTHRSQAGFANNARAAIFADSASTVNYAYVCNGTYALQTTGDVYVDGDITATGTISPFTGMHDGLMADTDSPLVGDILVDSSVAAKKDISNTLFVMTSSSSTNQPAIGVYAGDRGNEYIPVAIADHIEVTTIHESGAPTLNTAYISTLTDRKVVVVNSLGEGQINVCGEGGDISPGDLIVTSSTAGKGMKQSDDIMRSYTVAKAREGATFSAGEIKQIACIYLCG